MPISTRSILPPLLVFALAACSDEETAPRRTVREAGVGMTPAPDATVSGGSASEASASGSLGGPLMYTGDFTTGDVVPPRHMCEMPFGGGMGENISPPLEWSGGPEETKSFGLVLYDESFGSLHWVVWDIPVTATSLPEGIPNGYELADPAGAHQISSRGDGYFGPCSSGVVAQTYEYRLYALDVVTLPLTEMSTAAEAQTAVEAAAIESVIWAGKPE